MGIHYGLNEVVIERRTAFTFAIDLYINKVFAATIKADGCIFSSSTGSTAYNMSVPNGFAMHPEVECLIINPLAPLSLSLRPLIVNKKSEIMVQVNFPQFSKFLVK